MELFKLFGTIALNNSEANDALDETSDKAEKTESKIGKAFSKIGKAVVDGFRSEHPKKFSQSLDELTSTVNEQKTKLEELKDKYKNLYLTQGKNSKETRDCAKEIKELSKELGGNEKKLSKADKAADKFDKTLEKTHPTAEKFKNALSKMGSAAVKFGKVVATGLAAGTGAVIKLGKEAIDAYGDYEQLVGGVETLFGKSADIVMKYADNAYKTAGMSANQYMETVTSFSASLLQSLDGDTDKAAKKADKAITDMSDNANKMGSSIESIQNAYQGFAKQNYTMLDNLKLGYGGTKEEMQRLLSDAEKLSGQKFDLSSYADIVDAIHVVQTEMGITGTTAKEASTTIQGSVSSMKAAWQNLLVGMTDESQDFDKLLSNFVDSVITVIDNILPRVSVVAEKIPYLISALVGELPGIVKDILPSIIEAAITLVEGVVNALPSIISELIAVLPLLLDGMVSITNALVDALPQIVDSIIAFLTDQSTITNLIQAAITLFMAIVAAVPEIANQVLKAAPDIINGLINGLINSIPQLLEGLGKVLKNFLDLFLTFFGIHSPSTLMAEKAKFIVDGVINGIKSLPEKVAVFFAKMKDKALEIFANVKTGIDNKVESIKSSVSEKFNAVKEKILTPIENARDKIKEIIDKIKGFFSGLKLKFPNIPMPHFSVTPSGWKIGDLLEGSIPKLGIDWYAKAMDDGLIMNEPTVFGINSKGEAMAGGEVGSETVVGTQSLMSMIKTAVANENNKLLTTLNQILAVLIAMKGEISQDIIDALASIGIKYDERELARLVRKYA